MENTVDLKKDNGNNGICKEEKEVPEEVELVKKTKPENKEEVK